MSNVEPYPQKFPSADPSAPAEQPPPYDAAEVTVTPGANQQQHGPPPSGPYPSQLPYPPPSSGYSEQQGMYCSPSGGPYPPGVYAPSGQTIVVQVPPVHAVCSFNEFPVRAKCPHCQAEITTIIDYQTGSLAWIICAILFGLGFIVVITWCFCCIPFCISSCKDVVHKCPSCKSILGRKNRM